MNRSLVIILLSWFFVFTANAQVLNIPQFFTPRGEVSSDIGVGNDFSSMISTGGMLIPLSTKIKLKADFKNVKKLKDLKDVFKVEFSQLMLRANYRRSDFYVTGDKMNLDNVGVGLNGIHYIKKFRFLFYQGGVNYNYLSDIKNSGVSFSALTGFVKFMGFKDVAYYGVMGINHGPMNLVLPVLGWKHRINRKYSYSILFPSNAKLTYKLSRKVKVDAMTYTYSIRGKASDGNEGFWTQHFQLRSGMQIRYKLSKKLNLNAELGVAYGSKMTIWDDASNKRVTHLPEQAFSRVTLFYSFGKSLFNSGILDFGVE